MSEHKRSETKKEAHDEAASEEGTPIKGKPGRRQWLRYASIAVGLLAIVFATTFGYVYAVSPANIRSPRMEHLHFRMQLLVNGKAVDFSQTAFQTTYAKDQCNGDLPTVPIHFHDDKDQFVHIHWKDITGGQVLKDFGWNVIGGPDDSLGYRLDELPKIKKVAIHGNNLPALPKDAQFWVYVGDEKGYESRSFELFKNRSLETFFGTRSNFLTYEPSGNRVLNWFFPTASAHAGHDHSATTLNESDEERLTRINNLVGNVVIFVQPDKPSDLQIKARFANLLPLSDSTCGG
jgi:hypothetical protein